uniref:Uncharacterized protein n=1 Tax=Cucumis melo TaxID=3656 RepID=A0A9I9DG84_CUCME
MERGYTDTEMVVGEVVRDVSLKALPTCERDDVDKGLLLTHCLPTWSISRQWGTADTW